MFFGLWRGMLIATAGTWLGSLAAFLVGRILLRNRARRLLDRFPRAKLFVSALGRADVRTVVLTRLSPLVPFAAQNFGWAVTPVSFRRYALGSLIAVPVGASFFAHLGAAGRAGASMAVERFSWSAFLTVVGLAATFWLIRWISRIANEALKEELPSD